MDKLSFIFVVVLALSYVILILCQIAGIWITRKKSELRPVVSKKGVSVVIPFRNEAKHIKKLQSILNTLEGASNNCEFLWVNDQSTDDGEKMIDTKGSITHRVIPSTGEGKKSAIKTGVEESQFDIIATIDADVSLHYMWLQQITDFFSDSSKDFLIMPVLTKGEKSVWGFFEALDVLSLTGTTISWASLNNPIMCNGANMAFRRDLFLKHRCNADDLQLVSGDDLFFLHQVKKDAKKSIGYLYNESVQAHIAPFNDFSALVNQRVRWVSKNAAYKDYSVKLVAICVVLMYVSILLIGIGSIFFFSLIKLFFILFFTKFFIDFLYLFLLARKFNKLRILPWYPIAALMQFIFIPVVLSKSLLTSFEWKGRVYKR